MTDADWTSIPVTRVLSQPVRVDLRGRELEGRRGLRGYVEQRMLSTLGHLSRRVECVAISGEKVKRGLFRGTFCCRLVARLTRGNEVAEEQTGVDVYEAIDRAAEALARDVEHLESRLPVGQNPGCA